jgi:serpin B
MVISKLLALAGLVVALPSGAGFAAEATHAEAFDARVAIAQARLATSLIERASAPKKRVVALSPASLAGASTALDLGASHQFRTSLHAILGFQNSADSRSDLELLRERAAGLGQDDRGAAPLRYATSVVVDDGIDIYPAVPLALRKAGVDYLTVDFRSGAAAEKINKRIRDQTGGLIPEVIDRAPTSASLVVVNALYFNDRWKIPFDRTATKPKPFRRLGGGPVTVPTMHLPEGRYLFRRDARFVAIELPYADERFRMVIITTRGERPAPVRAFRAIDEWLNGTGFTSQDGELELPRFDISSREDLTGPLDALGLRSARLELGALAGFSGEPIRVTRIVQRVELRLDEEGTEAAAATAVVVERGVSPDYVRMLVDKPFVFALRDVSTGLILVAGYVGQPRTIATPTQ